MKPAGEELPGSVSMSARRSVPAGVPSEVHGSAPVAPSFPAMTMWSTTFKPKIAGTICALEGSAESGLASTVGVVLPAARYARAPCAPLFAARKIPAPDWIGEMFVHPFAAVTAVGAPPYQSASPCMPVGFPLETPAGPTQ